MEDPLPIGRGGAMPLAEIELRTSRSSGPGGQHANVTASRVEAVFDVNASRSLDDEQKRRIGAPRPAGAHGRAGHPQPDQRNRELALERMRARLESA